MKETLQFCIFWLVLNGIVANKIEVQDRYYPRYHLPPPFGWMNDPNGFCIFKNEYHLFYQHNPENSTVPGIAHWGHAVSKDLFNWIHKPIALYPDQMYDKSGVFSGSAIVENDVMYLIYTGNVNHPDENPDHEQHQALATSTDGVKFEKYDKNPIIQGADRQPNFRDPKVWKHGDTYYMVLGNSYENNTLGRVLLYTSNNRLDWTEVSILDQSNGTLGYMWECPDFFELDGRFVLLFSPQGIEPQGDKYKNLYQVGYLVGNFDYATNQFDVISNFEELDHGHDYYATQTILDKNGHRIVIAWFDMWDQNYPEGNDGFTGFTTIARQLSLTADNKLIQKPVKEISKIRSRTLHRGKGKSNKAVKLENKAGEVQVITKGSEDFKLFVEASDRSAKVEISYDSTAGTVTLDRGGADGVRRTAWKPTKDLKWHLFIDASSIELFCGEGEVTFSSRFFPNSDIIVRVAENSNADMLYVQSLRRSVPPPNKN